MMEAYINLFTGDGIGFYIAQVIFVIGFVFLVHAPLLLLSEKAFNRSSGIDDFYEAYVFSAPGVFLALLVVWLISAAYSFVHLGAVWPAWAAALSLFLPIFVWAISLLAFLGPRALGSIISTFILAFIAPLTAAKWFGLF